MTTDGERASLAQELLRLSLPELMDVLRRVLPAHTDHDATLVLAEISRLPGELFVEAVAWPDRDYYDGGFGPEPANHEQGTCPGCGVYVVSTAKSAFCPVCGTLCALT